jgi:hypothetical protein
MSTKLPTVNIKGKEYVMVKDRLKYFRETHSTEFSLTTEIIKLDDNVCVLKALVKDIEGRVIAEGMASEFKANGMINKTSYVENCETSAWGRALANFGIGIDDSVGSADEVATAINKQEQPTTIPLVFEKATQKKENIEEWVEAFLTQVSSEQIPETEHKKFVDKNLETGRKIYAQMKAKNPEKAEQLAKIFTRFK